MREGLRRWLIRGSWLGLLVCASLWLGLRLGRPLYYTDGERQAFGPDLAEAAVLRWGTPEPLLELPGPVRGRIAALPDGRLVYGRARSPDDTDLVVFDPARPTLPPEPLAVVNTGQHELAPALGPDGSLWFSSDRPGGRGGFDLWRAAPRGQGFGAPLPAPKGNTAFDETDPALSPDGLELAFVRVDRDLREGDNGTLLRARLDDEFDPAPPWPADRLPVTERDPFYAADGRSLWLVRRPAGEPAQVVRASRHRGVLDWPAVVAEWPQAALRSPVPRSDGTALLLVRPGSPDLLYQSRGELLQPWWPAQRRLERWLAYGALWCALLLLLLYLGRRFRRLDVITLCILLSLLLHLLLILWLLPMEVVRGFLPGPDDEGGIEVHLVSDAAAAAGGAEGDLATEARFRPEPRDLQAAAPAAAELARAEAPPHAAPAGEWQPASVAERPAPAVTVVDAAPTVAPRAGEDASVQPATQDLPAASPVATASATPQPARAPAAASSFAVGLPAAAPERSARPEPRPLSAPVLPPLADAVVRQPAATPPAPVALREPVAASEALRAGADPGPPPPPAPAVAAVSSPAASMLAPARAESGTDRAASVRPQPPAAGVAAATRVALPLPTPAGLPAALPVARSPQPAVSPSLRDASDLAPAGAPTTAEPAPALATAVPRPLPASALPQPGGAPMSRPAMAPAGQPVPMPGPPPSGLAAVRPRSELHTQPTAVPLPAPTGRPTTPAAVALRDPRPSQVEAAASVPPGRPGPQPAPLPVLGPHRPAAEPLAAAASMPRTGIASGDLRLPPSLLAPAPRRTALPALPPVAAAPSAYSNRFGPAKVQALEHYGGTAATERAVGLGLAYLARIQNRDGSWGSAELFDEKYGQVHIGKSALCVLAFLGAGHTHRSGSEWSDHVRRALQYLLDQQDRNGAFGPSSAYGHGIATYAITECYGITKDPVLRGPAERAVAWIVQNQGPRRDRRNRGGWGYFSPGLEREDDYARVSISAWMIMALESARLAGLDVPPDSLTRAREYLEQSFDAENGWFRYNQKPSRLRSAWPTLPASTPAAAFGLMLLGVPPDDERVRTALGYTVERRPSDYRRYRDDDFVLQGAGNVYFWYYGSLCCFLAGGESWQRWNAVLRELLPAAQSEDGSFAPIDVYARYAGDTDRDRSYTTAMCVLCLEVYYRYFTPLLVGR